MAGILTTDELQALSAPLEDDVRPLGPHAVEPPGSGRGRRQRARPRRFERFPRHVPVVLTCDGTVLRGTSEDVGLGGLSFLPRETGAPPETGARAHVRMRLPAPVRVVEAEGEVRWHDDTGTVGVRFEALRPEDVVALLLFFDATAPAGGGGRAPRDAG